MLRIQIETANAAFDEPGEIARILRGLATNFEGVQAEACHGRLRDTNGNVCGSYDYEPAEVDA